MGPRALHLEWLDKNPAAGTPAAWGHRHDADQQPALLQETAPKTTSTALVPSRPTATALALPTARIRPGELQGLDGHVIRSAAVRLAPVLLPPPPSASPSRSTLKYWTSGLLATSAIAVVSTLTALFSPDVRAIFSQSAAPAVKMVRTQTIKPDAPAVTTTVAPDGALQTSVRLPDNASEDQTRAIILEVTQAQMARKVLAQKMADPAAGKTDIAQMTDVAKGSWLQRKKPAVATPQKPEKGEAAAKPKPTGDRTRVNAPLRDAHKNAADGKAARPQNQTEPAKDKDDSAVSRFFKSLLP